jgi:hypothetical protein
MCKTDKSCIIELRSEDADDRLGGVNAKSTICRFRLPLRDIFKDHPVNDAGLWNIQVVYFGLYQDKGISNGGTGIDISCDQLSSPYIFSSRRSPKLVLATANSDIANDVSLDPTVRVPQPIGFFIGAGESHVNTCRVAFTDWTVRITNAQDGIDASGNITGDNTVLTSLWPSDNDIMDWVLRLKIDPYDPSHDK